MNDNQMPDQNLSDSTSTLELAALAWGIGAGFLAAIVGHIALVGLYWLPIPVRFLGAVAMPAYDLVTILAVLAGGCVAGYKAKSHPVRHVFVAGFVAGVIETLPTVLLALNAARTSGAN